MSDVKINPEIFRILEEKSFDIQNSVTYLLSIYFELKPTYIDSLTIRQVSASGILKRDYRKGTVNWMVPLLNQQPSQVRELPKLEMAWIEEYRQLFATVKAGAGGDKFECYRLMQETFAENPVLTPQIVLNAAKAYLSEFTSGDNDLKYLQRADYFIVKIYDSPEGPVKRSRLLQYADSTVRAGKKIRLIK